MQKITPHLWYDKEAREAAKLYISLFKDGEIKSSHTLHNTPSGDTDTLTIELFGQEFMLISAGQAFKFNPSVSFLVSCETGEQVDEFWRGLSQGGRTLMELGKYPFSERYG